MAVNVSDAVLDSPVGNRLTAGIERLFELSPDWVGRLSDTTETSAAQVDRSPPLKKESPRVVARQALPPSVVGMSLLSPMG